MARPAHWVAGSRFPRIKCGVAGRP